MKLQLHFNDTSHGNESPECMNVFRIRAKHFNYIFDTNITQSIPHFYPCGFYLSILFFFCLFQVLRYFLNAAIYAVIFFSLFSRWPSPNQWSNNHIWSKPAWRPEGSCYLSTTKMCRTLMTEVNHFALIIFWPKRSCTNQCLYHQSTKQIYMWKVKP